MSSKKGTVVKQAAFLMIATMICRVIGLLYRSPMHAVMGSVGDGYYTIAFDWYSIILLIASYSIPMAVSKVMSERLALGQYKNAQKVFKAALLYVCIVGGAASLFVYFGAPFLLTSTPGAIPALRILAPTIFLSGLLGVMRGYFQAHNTMMPTAISQIAEQIINAVISILAAFLFTRAVTGEEDIAVWGAAGGTLGTGAGVMIGLVFMVLVYSVNRKGIAKRVMRDTTKEVESYQQVFKTILLMVTPVIFSTCVYNVSSIINQNMYIKMAIAAGVDARSASSDYGVFGFQVKPILNIPIALGSATATALIPAIAASYAKGDKKDALSKVDESINLTTFIAIPASVGLCVLSYPIMGILYPGPDVFAAAVVLSMSSMTVLFYCLSSVTNGVLQGIGKPFLPVRNSAIALAVDVVVLFVGMKFFNMTIEALVMANILYALTVFVANQMSIKTRMNYKNQIKKSYLIPLAAALGMGVVAGVIFWVPYKLFTSVFEHYMANAILTAIAVLAGVLSYVIFFVILQKPTDEELKKMPMGTKLLKIVKMLHLR
ncbi:MAG: polysaccharide biosynthesis protein [Lachnospiraceae bacterium]|nr:polysaccharide biosynthesis protein [Lachnospiraceae bacterium]